MKFEFSVGSHDFEDIEMYVRGRDYALTLSNIFVRVRNINKYGETGFDPETVEKLYGEMWDIAGDYGVDPLG